MKYRAFSFVSALTFTSLLLLFVGCSSMKNIPDKDYLLNKYKIEIITDKKYTKDISLEDINTYIRNKPNKKIFFGLVKFHLFLYNLASERRDKGINGWLKKIGEAPVILDTFIVKKNTRQLKLYMNNKGFYNAKVKDSIVYSHKQSRDKKRKADVFYIINTSSPYIIRNINYSVKDEQIRYIVNPAPAVSGSLLKSGVPLDVDILQNERDRLTNVLKNEGYYTFSKDLIYNEIDTTVGNLQADITIRIDNPHIFFSKDSVIEASHKRFLINNLYIYTDYYGMKEGTEKKDTMVINEFHFIYSAKDGLKYKPNVLIPAIFIRKGQYFEKDRVTKTYNRLADIGSFKFVNIQFNPPEADPASDSLLSQLDCIIQLTPSAVQSFSIESQGTHSAGDLGIAGNLIYQNKNVYNGAEIFELKLRSGLEIQNVAIGEVEKDIPFNTIEFGPELHMYFPKFLLPVSTEKFPLSNNPKTTFSALYNFQKRPDYTRYISKGSFAYTWKESTYRTYTVAPFEANIVKIIPVPTFEEYINSLDNEYIKYSFTDHLTTNTRWTIIFSNQDIKKLRNFRFSRINLEFSGNTLWLINNILSTPKDTLGYYRILNIVHSQYIKFDWDHRYYFIFNQNTSVVFRLFAGLGLPYGNSLSLPFEKSYFAGGSQDIRAWNARRLGPGAYYDKSGTVIDQFGDIKLEANVEYRFPLYRYLKGAFFIDAGNIWLLRKDEMRPKGNFAFDRFLGEIAIGGGVGARLDFSYFIIRFDAAVPLKNPIYEKGYRWIDARTTTKDIIFSLGIGYPF